MNPATTFTLEELDGGQDPQNATEFGDEADADLQYTIGIATGVNVSFLSVGGVLLSLSSETNVEFGNALVDTNHFLHRSEELPSVVSTSYAIVESSIDPGLVR